jgi:hypothetical protein
VHYLTFNPAHAKNEMSTPFIIEIPKVDLLINDPVIDDYDNGDVVDDENTCPYVTIDIREDDDTYAIMRCMHGRERAKREELERMITRLMSMDKQCFNLGGQPCLACHQHQHQHYEGDENA